MIKLIVFDWDDIFTLGLLDKVRAEALGVTHIIDDITQLEKILVQL